MTYIAATIDTTVTNDGGSLGGGGAGVGGLGGGAGAGAGEGGLGDDALSKSGISLPLQAGIMGPVGGKGWWDLGVSYDVPLYDERTFPQVRIQAGIGVRLNGKGKASYRYIE